MANTSAPATCDSTTCGHRRRARQDHASFAIKRAVRGRSSRSLTSADASVTAGNGEYTLAGAVYAAYQGGSLVAQFTTDESGHGQTSEKFNGDYVVREIARQRATRFPRRSST
ncbi:MAG: hypothetical protein ACLSVD_01555 [Eggerthellaceae bacterium]